MSNEVLVFQTIQRFPDRDDDELSEISGVLPRQQVNQICRRLERDGVVERVKQPGKKIINRIRRTVA